MDKLLKYLLIFLVAVGVHAQSIPTTALPAPSLATDRPDGVHLANSRIAAGFHQVDAPVTGSPTLYGGCGMVPDSTTGLDGTDNYAAWLACTVQYPTGHFVLGAGMYRFSHDFILLQNSSLEGTQFCPNVSSPASTVFNCGSTIVVPGGVNGMHVQAGATYHDFNIINAQDGHARIPGDSPTVMVLPAGANLTEFQYYGSSNAGNLSQFQRVSSTGIVTATVNSTVGPELARDNVIQVLGSGTFNGTFYVNSVAPTGSVWLVTWTQPGADETIGAASIGTIQPATTGASNSSGIIYEGVGSHGYNMGVSNFAHSCVTHFGGDATTTGRNSDDVVFSNSWLSGCAIGLNIMPGSDTSKGTYSHLEVFSNLINGDRGRSFLGDTFTDFQASFNAGSFVPGGGSAVTITSISKASGLATVTTATAHGGKVGNAVQIYGTSVAGDNLKAPTAVTRCDVTAFVLTCNAVAHGLTVGAPIELDGGSDINLNGIDTSISTVPDADHFTANLVPYVQTSVNSTGGTVNEEKISGYIATVPDATHFTVKLVNNTSSTSSTGGTVNLAGGQAFMYAFAGLNAAHDIGVQNLNGHNIASGMYTEGHRIHSIDQCDVRFNDSVLVTQGHFSGNVCGGDQTLADKDFGHRTIAAVFTVNASSFAFKPYANGNPTVASVVSWNATGDVTAHSLTCTGTPCGSSSSGSTKIVYTSKLAGINGNALVAPGSVTYGTDDAATLNTALSGGNIDLVVDGQYGLSTSLLVASNTRIRCLPGNGFIMQTAANKNLITNKNFGIPTTSDGNGGFLVGNQVDHDITVDGCILNANSAVAATGTSHRQDVAGPTLLYTALFYGVDKLTFTNNLIYDSPSWQFIADNVTNVLIDHNILKLPAGFPITGKNTDGIHIDGPSNHVIISNNHITAGDDAIALNADDGQRTGSGDAAAPLVTAYNFKWGPITDVYMDSNDIDNSEAGIRILSTNSRVDRIHINKTSGTVHGGAFLLDKFYTTLGNGNVGQVAITDWSVEPIASDGFSVSSWFYITENIDSLLIDGLTEDTASIGFPIIRQNGQTIGNLALRNFVLNTVTGNAQPGIVKTESGTITNLSTTGFSWNDASSGTGTVFYGAMVPSTIACSSYAGPNRLLAAGYSPAKQNGDCFTNTYSAATTYMNTVFNEAGSGALAGTTPATCTSCTGTWTLASGTDWTYSGSSSISTAAANAAPDLIDVGHADATFRWHISVDPGTADLQFDARTITLADTIAINVAPSGGSAGIKLYDCVASSCTQVGSTLSGTYVGDYTLVLSGTSATLTTPSGATSGTVAHVTGTKAGFHVESPATSATLTSMSVKSF